MEQAIGIDIGGSSVKMGLYRNGKAVWQKTFPTSRNPERVAWDIARFAKAVNCPVGAACAGNILSDGSVVAENLNWYKVPLKAIMENTLQRQVILLNDASAACLAEWRMGALMHCQHGVLITFGTGIGSAAIFNGMPYEGRDNLGLEAGHLITHAGGEKCPCGQSGCFERYASAGALGRLFHTSARQAVARSKAHTDNGLWQIYLKEVCIGLTSVLSAYAPEILALGGGLCNDPFVPQQIASAMKAQPYFERLYSTVRIIPAAFQNEAGMLGAALTALHYGSY